MPNWENKTKAEILRGADPGYLHARKVARNTVRIVYPDKTVIRYHSTNIVTTYEDGLTMLDSGGWHTQTTMRRIHDFSGIQVVSVRLDRRTTVWELPDGRMFRDGIMVRTDPVLDFDEYEE